LSKIENAGLALLILLVLLFLADRGLTLWEGLIAPAATSIERGLKPTDRGYVGLTAEEIGTLVLQAQGCLACHNLDLQGGVVAPSLDNVGIRRNEGWLRDKVRDPHEKLPGTYMPAYAYLNDEELEGLVTFLRTLTPARPSPDNTGEAQIEIPTDEQGQPRFTVDQVERGKLVFQQRGCIGCHAINGIAPGGPVGPNLTHEALRKRTDEWQLQHLINPVSVYVAGELPQGATWIMPPYGQLSREDLEALVAFLQSLK
jgi:mono/diheme cytochrome c family protein